MLVFLKTNRMVTIAKFRFWFLLQGLTWAVLHVWTQNNHQNLGKCPGLPFQLLTWNLFSKVKGLTQTPTPLTVVIFVKPLCSYQVMWLLTTTWTSKNQINSQKLAPLPCSGGNYQSLHWTVSAQRSVDFDSFYLSVSEVVDDFSLFAITKYINATGRLNTATEWQD